MPLNIALASSVREMLLHILAVEQRYAERLNDMEVTPYEAHSAGSVGELFAIGARRMRCSVAIFRRRPTKSLGLS